MGFFAAIGFLSPYLLLGLVTLPILWWLLRATPPAALRRNFPAVVLLLGLRDPETTPDRTPWWLLALRMLAIGALIIGFAGPVLNPEDATLSRNPVLILRDGGWASAPDWRARQEKVADLLESSARQGRPVALINLADGNSLPEGLEFRSGTALLEIAGGAEPAAFLPDYTGLNAWAAALPEGAFDTIWLSDGLDGAGKSALAAALTARGRVTIMEAGRATLALAPAGLRDGQLLLRVMRDRPEPVAALSVSAFGPDPAGIERRLASRPVRFEEGALETELAFDLPSELRNRITRFALDTIRSTGARSLADDRLKRRKIVLIGDGPEQEGQALVSPLHFLRKALGPTADLIEAPLAESLLANPDVIVLADVAGLIASEQEALLAWVEGGGLLLRFAGPRLASFKGNVTLGGDGRDPLLPVRLREGGRSVGGAMSWGAPKKLAPFASSSPFYGLTIPKDVEVTAQVIAEPGPLLAERTIAALQDGTPLVTEKTQADGRVVLFHVSANAEWSSLPLSGLFVQMLERLAVSTSTAQPAKGDLAGQLWQPMRHLTGFGDLIPADHLLPVAGEKMAELTAGKDLVPGLYQNGERQVAINAMGPEATLARAEWPGGVTRVAMTPPEEQPLKAILLMAGLVLLMVDILATLFLSGRLTGPRAGIVALLALGFMSFAPEAGADDERAQLATGETVLAFVMTGDGRVDAASEAGLYGLSRVLTERTSIEPIDPIGVDLERDELAFYPLLYWPVSETQAIPSAAAYRKLNAFIRNGGMILFDTRDAHVGRFGTTPNGQHLRRLAASLDIPALEPVPRDHVLTRSFYLLQDFPGRHSQGKLWVEASPADAVRPEGLPFRNLNDGVSPVLIGGNDWASAWAMSRDGQYLYPLSRRGFAGQRQREISFRFGVNLVMYVLTGNYKSDQVHVPALLERLGQ